MSELEYYTPQMIDELAKASRLKDVVSAAPDGPPYQYPTHLMPAMNREERKKTVKKCIQELDGMQYDTLAFSGVSGASFGFILAEFLDKEIISVRQPGVKRRAGNQYNEEGYRHALKYIVIDDLISTGITVARVINGVQKIAPQAELAGILLYYHGPKILKPPTFNDGDSSYGWNSVQSALARIKEYEKSGDLREF